MTLQDYYDLHRKAETAAKAVAEANLLSENAYRAMTEAGFQLREWIKPGAYQINDQAVLVFDRASEAQPYHIRVLPLQKEPAELDKDPRYSRLFYCAFPEAHESESRFVAANTHLEAARRYLKQKRWWLDMDRRNTGATVCVRAQAVYAEAQEQQEQEVLLKFEFSYSDLCSFL